MSFISKIFGKKDTSSASLSGAQSAYDICDAARDGNEPAVIELLGKGADINSTGGRTLDFSPLMWASEQDNMGMLRLLLDRGANPNLRNSRGVNALMLAATKGYLDAVRLLLDRGANVHFETQEVSPLSAAAAYGHLGVVRILLERGAKDNKGRALEGASQIGHQEIMNLLKRGGSMTQGHWSRIATQLRCVHCGNVHRTYEWPLKGDYEAVYFGENPGKFSLKVTCPLCKKDWYVYWYEDPGPIRALDL